MCSSTMFNYLTREKLNRLSRCFCSAQFVAVGVSPQVDAKLNDFISASLAPLNALAAESRDMPRHLPNAANPASQLEKGRNSLKSTTSASTHQ